MSNTPPSDVENPTVLPTRLTCEGVPCEVWIAVDGKEAPLYAKEYDETKKEVTCWIESEAGKAFSIHFNGFTDEYAMGLKVFLDGCPSAHFLVLPIDKNIEWRMDCIRTSQLEGQRLTFGLLELTDDDAYLNQSSKSENFGEIRFVVDKKASYTHIPGDACTFRLPETQKVHERSKKGLNHRIKPGPSEPMRKAAGRYASRTVGVLATFIVRYRTRAMLQANGVIAPAPIPPVLREQSEPANSSSAVKRALSEEQSDNDQDEMDERERALLAELEEIRRNKRTKDSGGSTRKKVKVESNTAKLHFKRGEVIDLTDDAPKAQRKSREMKKEIVDLTL